MEEKTYTLDELKSEVDKFREYLLEVCSKNECSIDVNFESISNNYVTYTTREVNTKINIY